LSPWKLPALYAPQLAQAGEVLASQFGLRGLFGVDFIFDGQQIWIIEINPRVTAASEVVERVTGDHVLAEHLAMFGIDVPRNCAPCVPAAGKVVVYAKSAVVISPDESARLLANSTFPAPLRV